MAALLGNMIITHPIVIGTPKIKTVKLVPSLLLKTPERMQLEAAPRAIADVNNVNCSLVTHTPKLSCSTIIDAVGADQPRRIPKMKAPPLPVEMSKRSYDIMSGISLHFNQEPASATRNCGKKSSGNIEHLTIGIRFYD